MIQTLCGECGDVVSSSRLLSAPCVGQAKACLCKLDEWSRKGTSSKKGSSSKAAQQRRRGKATSAAHAEEPARVRMCCLLQAQPCRRLFLHGGDERPHGHTYCEAETPESFTLLTSQVHLAIAGGGGRSVVAACCSVVRWKTSCRAA